MKSLLLCLVFCVLALSMRADTLTIIHLNDTHSNLAPGGPRTADLKGSIGGIARAATAIGMIKATNPNVLTLHAGDIYIGDVFFQRYYGVAELQLMSALGFDAMTVGNHEFDLTPYTLLTALDTAFATAKSFPLLSANAILSNDSIAGLRKYIKPYSIHTVNGIKVGVFGLTTPATNILSMPAPVIIDTNIVSIATEMVDSLRQQKCSVIICLSHLGVMLDQAIAQYVDGIDLIVGGHDHYVFDKAIQVANLSSGHKVPIVQAGSFYHDIGVVKLDVSKSGVSLISNTVQELNSSIPEEESVKALVDAMVADIENTYGQLYTKKIADADDDFEEVAEQPMSNGIQDTPIGNLVSDAFRAVFKTQVAFEPGGSTAQKFYKGPLVAADAFRVTSYGFNMIDGLGYRMATCTLSGAEIMAGLEFGCAGIEENDEYLLQCSGMQYVYNPNSAPMQRIKSVKIGNDDLQLDKDYSVAINEFVVAFLSFLEITPRDVQIHNDSTEFRVFAAYVQANNSIKPQSEGRVRADGTTDVSSLNATTDNSLMVAPNPSSQLANINLQLNQAEHVRVVVYDSQLREVKTLFDDEAQAGDLRLSLDTTQLANGAYFVKCSGPSKAKVTAFVVRH